MQKSSLRMSLNLILTKSGWLVLSTTYLVLFQRVRFYGFMFVTTPKGAEQYQTD